MTAAVLLALVEEYGQAVGWGQSRKSSTLLAQIGAAVTRLANERDELAERLDSIEAAGVRDPKVCLDHNTPMTDRGDGHWGCPAHGCLNHFYLPDATKEH